MVTASADLLCHSYSPSPSLLVERFVAILFLGCDFLPRPSSVETDGGEIVGDY